jgi:hypothetical protein
VGADCAGICGGSAQLDCAGICNGGAHPDCAGICNGNTQYDCAGICGGTTEIDCYGNCGGNVVWTDCNGTRCGSVQNCCAPDCVSACVNACNQAGCEVPPANCCGATEADCSIWCHC